MTSALSGAAAPRAPHRIDQIDSLRCLAMTMVIAQHCRLLPVGWTGVWLFFVISGFVVTSSLLARAANGAPGERLIQFYGRRAARILPIYMLYAVLGALWSAAQTGAFEWRPFLSLVFFYNDFETVFGRAYYQHFPSGHLWTVSIEMQFYLFFGLAFVLLPRRVLVPGLTTLLVLVPVLRLMAGVLLARQGVGAENSAFAIYTASVLQFDSFALGALLALHGDKLLKPGMALRLFWAGLGALALFCASYALVNAMQLGETGLGCLRNIISGILFGQHREVFVYSAVALASAGVIAATASGHAPWAGLTKQPLFQMIGRCSYGGYVYHMIWVDLALLLIAPESRDASPLGVGQRLLTFAIAYPLTVAMAHLSFVHLEQPIMAAAGARLKRRRTARSRALTPVA
jgi:peptidoglycan/LPS O-acetylase OafA/YrhL